jgi:hypothetical protein
MINRKDFTQEMLLRENVRKAIKVVLKLRSKVALEEQKNEVKLRSVIRKLIAESQSAVATSAKHNSTGINVLEDLLKNSNLLSTFEEGYKSLTTDKAQRESYRKHIVVFVKNAIAPEESRKLAGRIRENTNIDIGSPTDDPDFIDVADDDRSDDEVKIDTLALPGEDKTGRNKAYRDFATVEKSIIMAYDDLDNEQDAALFEEYLIKNLSLYFDKFEAELETNPEVPDEAKEASLGSDGSTEASLSAELPGDAAPAIELEESLNFNIEDIINNLLRK